MNSNIICTFIANRRAADIGTVEKGLGDWGSEFTQRNSIFHRKDAGGGTAIVTSAIDLKPPLLSRRRYRGWMGLIRGEFVGRELSNTLDNIITSLCGKGLTEFTDESVNFLHLRGV